MLALSHELFLQNFSDVGFSYFTGWAIPGICVLPPGVHKATSEWLVIRCSFSGDSERLLDEPGKRHTGLQLLLLLPPWSPSADSWILMFTEHSLHARHGVLNLWGRYYYFAYFTNEKLRFRETVLRPKIIQLASGRDGDSKKSSLHQNW